MKLFNCLSGKKSTTVKEDGPNYHTMTVSEVVAQLQTNLDTGLTKEDYVARLKQYGSNKLVTKFRTPTWRILLRHALDVYNVLLLVAMVQNFIMKDILSGVIYVVLIVINAGIGLYQDFNSQMTIDCLSTLTSFNSKVLRDGSIVSIPSKDLVPGDVLLLEAGDVIGADARLFEQGNFAADEAHITGESVPVEKDHSRTFSLHTPAGDQLNMVFSGSTATKGRAKAIVGYTGMNSQMGLVAETINNAQAGNSRFVKKSFRLMGLALIVLLAPMILLMIYAVGKVPDNVRMSYSISLAVAIFPKSLDPIATISSFLGIKRMLTHNAIVRRNDILEISGSITNICTDKTGTLTLAKMVVTQLWIPGLGYFKVTGDGYSPVGDVFYQEPERIVPINDLPDQLICLARTASLCNNSKIKKDSDDKQWIGQGDPTEAALLSFACKLNLSRLELTDPTRSESFELLFEFSFDPTLKLMSSVYMHQPSGRTFIYTKGALESVVPICDRYMENGDVIPSSEAEILKLSIPHMESLANAGLRSLCFAFSEISPEINISAATSRSAIEKNLTFLGLVGIYDPPRPETKQTILNFHRAGITVHMLTGDHIATATAIAKEVAVIEENALVTEGMVMQATEFDRMDDNDLDALAELPLVVARCSPNTKAKMIHALHRRKRTVAMTGDGVNDSPSLRIANVGIGMGLAGADVAKQASGVVISDDNFSTIVTVIKEGRRALTNIINVTRFLLATNSANFILMMLGLIIKGSDGRVSLHISSLQMLLLHIISIPPVALGLGIEPSPKRAMNKPPRPVSHGIFTWEVMLDILVYGVFISGLTFASYWILLFVVTTDAVIPSVRQITGDETYEVVFRARAASFLSFVLNCLINSVNCRSMRKLSWSISELKNAFANKVLVWSIVFGFLISIPFIYIPGINQTFYSAPISWEWAFVPINGILFIILSEIYKILKQLLLGEE